MGGDEGLILQVARLHPVLFSREYPPGYYVYIPYYL